MGEQDRMSLVDKAIIALRSMTMSGELEPSARVAEVALSPEEEGAPLLPPKDVEGEDRWM